MKGTCMARPPHLFARILGRLSGDGCKTDDTAHNIVAHVDLERLGMGEGHVMRAGATLLGLQDEKKAKAVGDKTLASRRAREGLWAGLKVTMQGRTARRATESIAEMKRFRIYWVNSSRYACTAFSSSSASAPLMSTTNWWDSPGRTLRGEGAY